MIGSPPSASWDSLSRPLRLLSRIHRLDLLRLIEKRSGTALDRRLGKPSAFWVNSLKSLDHRKLRSVLIKFSGEGLRIRMGIGSSDVRRQREALNWGAMFPDEIAASSRTLGAHAFLGEDQALVAALIKLENLDDPFNPGGWEDWLTSLWSLRRGRPPMTDEALVPALEALKGDVMSRLGGMEAIAISGRSDLLSGLPDWLTGLEGLDAKQYQRLDHRASYLVHRLAEDAEECVQKLCRSLDFEYFPALLANLYGKLGAEGLPDLLEQHLLERLGSGIFGEAEMDFALTLSRSRTLSPAIVREVWNYGKNDQKWNRMDFWRAVAVLDSEEVHEQLWRDSLNY